MTKVKFYKFSTFAEQYENGKYPLCETEWIRANSYKEAEEKFMDYFMNTKELVEVVEEYGSVSVKCVMEEEWQEA